MHTYGNQGVLFSEDYFTEESLDWILRPASEVQAKAYAPPVARAAPAIATAEPAEVKTTPESAYSAAWELIMRHPEMKQAAEQAGYTLEQGLAEFLKTLETPPPENIDKQMANALKIDYVSGVEDGNFVHRIDGEKILSIPTSVKGAATISLNVDAIFYGIFTLIDTILIMCALCQVIVSPDKRAAATNLKSPLKRFLVRFSDPKYIVTLREWKKKGWYGHMMISILVTMDDTADSEGVLTKLFSYLTPIQIISIVASVVAYILLSIASGGAALGYRLAALGAMVAFFVGDFLQFIKALGLVDDQPIIQPPPPHPPPAPPHPPGPPEGVFRGYYIGNSNTREVHNLYDLTPNCLFEQIKEEHKIKFDSFEDVYRAFTKQGYNGCHWCMPDYDTG